MNFENLTLYHRSYSSLIFHRVPTPWLRCTVSATWSLLDIFRKLTMWRYAPFVYDTWKHPKTLEIVSQIAGIDLVTEMDLEIGHINISVKSEQQRQDELQAYAEKAHTEADEGIAGCPWEDDKPIVDWHRDSYPFVCVTMLSDCSTMIGGETALRTGTGEILKVRGPDMVSPGFSQPVQTHLISLGMRRCATGPIYRASGLKSTWGRREDYNGYLVSPAMSKSSRRYGAYDGAADI